MTNSNPKVEEFLSKETKWKAEFEKLREIIHNVEELTEEFKWMHPCYTYENKNVVLIHGFKEYCALLFHKGSLLKDPHGILIQQSENVQAARQIRFTSLQQIIDLEDALNEYVHQAIDLEKSGAEIVFKQTTEFTMAEEFQTKLDENPDLKTAFEALTPGRQRAYLLHFSTPKQSKTRESRIEKCIPKIFEGKGLNDR
ncbi:YdeI family protein [Ureibacillus chungkukjangi]|uniref:YdeI/OmpD-associated family protein n=1 Tax=Ureibacillus chungkukjangi TaxID=1202712 RepID=UPI00203C8BA6|nr:YdeI family protein [Ureibacillus chungkukjangi]